MRMKVLLAAVLCLGIGTAVAPAQLASPYSNSVYPAKIFTAAGTSTPIQLNGLVVSSTVGSSFTSGTITLAGTSLTTVTFAVQGSSDNGATYYAIPIYVAASPTTAPATSITATANGLYQVNLAGLTHIKFVTSGTFTATNVTFTLTASPNGLVSRNSSGGGAPTGAAGGSLNGTYPNPGIATVNPTPGTCGDATHSCQVTTNAAGQTTTQTPVVISASGVSYSNYGGVNVMGDSIPATTGSVNYGLQGSLATGYGADLIADFGGNGTNYSYGGDQAADLSLKVYANLNPAESNNFVTTFGISTNDVNVYGTDVNKQNIFKRALQGASAWASTPDSSKFFTKDTNFCARAGTWANDTGGPRGGSIYSVTNASSLTCSITVPAGSSAIYYGYAACDGYTGGSAHITIDGVAPSTDATVASTGQAGASIATANGATCAYMAARYPTTAGAHSFVITTSGTGVVEPLWIGTPKVAPATTPAPPLLLVGGTPWNQNDSPSTTTAAYNTIIASTIAAMTGDGAPVYFVDIRNGTNTRNSNTTTPLNSDQDYNGGVEGTITCPVSALNPYHPNSTPYWSRACGHGHLAANFEAAIGIKAGGPSPSPAVSGPTLAPRGYSVAGNGTGNYGYGFSANGDMRPGSLAGFYFGASGDSDLHMAVPTVGGCYRLDNGNSPAPGITPAILNTVKFCTNGDNSFVETQTQPPSHTGTRVLHFNAPNLLGAGSTAAITVGTSKSDFNNVVFAFSNYGPADVRNHSWMGVQDFSGSVPGICTTANGSIGIGYRLGDICPNTSGNTTLNGALTTTGPVNGVNLQTGGPATNYLDQTGVYSTPPGGTVYTGTMPIVVSGAAISCPTCSVGTGTNVTVNGGGALGTANLNSTTPSAPDGNTNVTFQQSGNDVSAYIPTAYSVLPVPPATASFTWVNQGSNTVSNNGNVLAMTLAPTGGGNSLSILKQAVPGSTPWSVATFYKSFQWASNAQITGLYLTDGTKFYGIENISESANIFVFRVSQWTNGSTSATAVYTAGSGALFNYPWSGGVYLRWRDDGTNLYADMSPDGANWTNLYSQAVGTFLTPTGYGFGGENATSANTPMVMSMQGWLKTSSGSL